VRHNDPAESASVEAVKFRWSAVLEVEQSEEISEGVQSVQCVSDDRPKGRIESVLLVNRKDVTPFGDIITYSVDYGFAINYGFRSSASSQYIAHFHGAPQKIPSPHLLGHQNGEKSKFHDAIHIDEVNLAYLPSSYSVFSSGQTPALTGHC